MKNHENNMISLDGGVINMEKTLTLSDYRDMEINRIYYFDNLRLVFDGNILLSKYPIESFWHPFYEDGEWFEKWKDRELTKTDKFY